MQFDNFSRIPRELPDASNPGPAVKLQTLMLEGSEAEISFGGYNLVFDNQGRPDHLTPPADIQKVTVERVNWTQDDFLEMHEFLGLPATDDPEAAVRAWAEENK